MFYFPEDMLRQAGDKKNDKEFAAEVWTSLFLKGPMVVDIVSTNIQLIIKQYMSGQGSCFGLRYSSALADKQKLLMIRYRSLADAKEEPAAEKATPWHGWVEWSESTSWNQASSASSAVCEGHWEDGRYYGWRKEKSKRRRASGQPSSKVHKDKEEV